MERGGVRLWSQHTGSEVGGSEAPDHPSELEDNLGKGVPSQKQNKQKTGLRDGWASAEQTESKSSDQEPGAGKRALGDN